MPIWRSGGHVGLARVPVVLAIGGSDSGGGAGIQADLKALAAVGVHGTTAITALTAQNTLGVSGVVDVDPIFVGVQIDAVANDMYVHVVKTGMLAQAATVAVVAAKVVQHNLSRLVVDPVLRASTGASLANEGVLEAIRRMLLPLASVVTPNLAEAAALTGIDVTSLHDMREAARRIHALGPGWVVVKGGHLDGALDAVDVLYDGRVFHELMSPRIAAENSHGTGCTFASALAGGLALGMETRAAVGHAKEVVTEALRFGLHLGGGAGPVNGLALLYEQAGLTDQD